MSQLIESILAWVKQNGIEHCVVTLAVLALLVIHLKHIVFPSPLGRAKWAKAFLDALLKDDHHTREELARVLRLGVFEHRALAIAGDYRKHCHALLKKCIKVGTVTVGIKGTTYLEQKAFCDAISKSLSPKMKAEMASCLRSHFLAERQKNINLKDVVGVVGIKRGSPWLAIEFAKQINDFPIALHRGEPRVNTENPKHADFFDGDLPLSGKKVVIIDDSVTGGTMMLEAIDHLRALQIDVVCCLVLFEVLGKDGRKKLADKGVHLLTICTFDGRNEQLKQADEMAFSP